jgi:hypothetical protein
MARHWKVLARICSALCLLAAATVAQAQPADAQSYPWDTRPLKCRFPEAAGFEMCRLDLWPTREKSVGQLRGLAQLGQYELLERAFKELSSSGEFFPSRRYKAESVYVYIGELLKEQRELGRGSTLDKWKESGRNPESLCLADALQLHRSAWETRGGGFASSVSAESWKLFEEKLRMAEDKAMRCPAWLKETPVWHQVLLVIAMEGRSSTSWQDLFATAAKRWPRYIAFHEQVVPRMIPKWGGSWQAVEQFAANSAASVAATEGMSFYARVYVILGNDLVREKTNLDWAKMKQGLEDWNSRYASPIPKNLYAAHACFARDKAAFAAIFPKIPREQIEPEFWLAGYSPEACAQWAGR